MKCSVCKTPLEVVKDFGKLPLSNELLESAEIKPKKYSLKLAYCKECELLQLATKLKSEILFKKDYPYKSGVSKSFVEHCKTFAESLTEKTKGKETFAILEIGGNDGTLAKEIIKVNPNIYYCIVDPCAELKIHNEQLVSIDSLFSKKVFKPGQKFDLIIFQNSFAHLPNPKKAINDCYSLLKDNGEIIIELPIAEYTVKNAFWETVYFEHQFYWSVGSIKKFMLNMGLYLYRIKHLENIQGGSARFTFSKNCVTGLRHFTKPMNIYKELKNSILKFDERRKALKEFIDNVIKNKPIYMKIVGVTAPSKTALLVDLLDNEIKWISFLVDDTPDKQGKFLACRNGNIPIKPFLEIPKDSVCIILSKNYEEVLSEKVKQYKPSVIFCP